MPSALRARGARTRARTARTAMRTTTTAAAAAATPFIKICGVTTPEDATLAAAAGATYIGMILWPKSKRSISLEVAATVAAAAKAGGAIPVGVFVDESAEAGLDTLCPSNHLSYPH